MAIKDVSKRTRARGKNTFHKFSKKSLATCLAQILKQIGTSLIEHKYQRLFLSLQTRNGMAVDKSNARNKTLKNMSIASPELQKNPYNAYSNSPELGCKLPGQPFWHPGKTHSEHAHKRILCMRTRNLDVAAMLCTPLAGSPHQNLKSMGCLLTGYVSQSLTRSF